MSQKVHPKGFRLRSTGHIDSSNPSTTGAWDSVWFSEPKKGKHFYTRILHEDQLIQDYTKGFFRSFGFYQQKCVIERKCNKELHITSYVLRTPKLQPSKLDVVGTRTRQEKVLQEGLQQGWIPFLIKSVISKILYDKSKLDTFGIRLDNWVPTSPDRVAKLPNSSMTQTRSVRKRSFQISSVSKLESSLPQTLTKSQIVPSILPILPPQENSVTQMETNKKRFYDFWNSWLINKNFPFGGIGGEAPNSKILNATSLSEPKGLLKDTEGKMSLQNMWWVHRSWSSTIYYPSSQTNTEKLKQSPERAAFELGSEATRSGAFGTQFPLQGDRVLKAPDLIPVNLIYSIRPAQSLVVSSQLIVDYIADKIEQSVSIQQIFNEILRFFETEALCVGPSFISTQQRSDITEKLDGMSSNIWYSETKFSNAKRSEAKVLGDVKESSNHYVNKNESLQRPKILGFRIICSGRLQISSFSKPAEKAESIEITRGVLPLNTFKSNIDFAQTDATNAYGTCGIKVWVNRGE